MYHGAYELSGGESPVPRPFESRFEGEVKTMSWRLRGPALLVAVILFGTVAASAQPAIQPTVDITKVPAAAQPSPHFNVDEATEAYMAMMPPDAIARSNAYFEGGYWLILWDFLYASAVCLIVLNTGWSAAMRDRAQRITRFRWLQNALYWMQYVLLTSLLGFPLEYYESFVREHKYGMATQTFLPWMGDELKGLALSAIMGAIAFIVLFAIVRKSRETWWIWGTVVSIVFIVISIAIGPVFIQPMFNTVHRLDDPKITGPILRMAHANGISTNDVYEIDASRQTTRMSANVSGIGNTMRITLNDNLLKRGSPEEIQAVMGHEMGHYILNHIPMTVLFLSVVFVLFFAYLRWALRWTLARWGDRWGIHEIADPAVLPLVFLLGGLFFFVLTPISNTQIASPTASPRPRFTWANTAKCAPARWKNGSSSTIQAATIAFTPQCNGRARIFNSLKSRIARHQPSRQFLP
jgi:STE24 endopeptidase